MNADDDKKKKELVEARNSADSLIYSTEKSIKELGDKVDSETKTKIEEASSALKKAMEGEDAEEIKRLSEEMTQVSHKLAEAMYQQAAAADQQAAGTDAGSDKQAGAAAPEEDVVDADFEEVKEDEKK
jgi:molecular chaperone DnaK